MELCHFKTVYKTLKPARLVAYFWENMLHWGEFNLKEVWSDLL